MSDSKAGLPCLEADVEKMTAYCTYCPKMCRFSCPTAAAEGRETVTPWGMMRLLELARDGSVPLDRDVADTFFHCTGCRRCRTYCRHGNDVPRALRQARRWVVDQDHLPEPLAEMDRDFARHQTGFEEPPLSVDTDPFDQSSPIAFWPDCATVQRSPKTVAAVGRLLEKVLGHKVRLIRNSDTGSPPCCGFPRFAAGITNEAQAQATLIEPLAGLEAVYTDCPALASFDTPQSSFCLPQSSERPLARHLFDLLAERLPELGPPPSPFDLSEKTLHESCYISRQIQGLDSVHKLLSLISEEPPLALPYQGEESPCCGGRLHYRRLEPEASLDAARLVINSAPSQEEPLELMTTSSMCHCALAEAAGQESPQSRAEIISFLDLIATAYDCI